MPPLPASRGEHSRSHCDSPSRPRKISMRSFSRPFLVLLFSLVVTAPLRAEDFSFPRFAVREVAGNGATIHVRSGGSGPAVVLLHGYGETGDMWAPLARDLAKDHTVIVPELRGL